MKYFLRLFPSKSKICSLSELQDCIRYQASKISGELVIKYAQKRLGKLHYNLSKTSANYSQEIIDCQARLHAEVLSDFYCILLKVFKTKDSEMIQRLLFEVHQQYIQTIPDKYIKNSYLISEQHFSVKSYDLGKLANNTGTKLFKMLPANNNLLPGNVKIFRGQLRFSYIAFLELLGNRCNIEKLSVEIHGYKIATQ